MHEDVEAADRMVVSLGDLLRATLSGEGGQEVSLGRELEVLDLYLRIQLIRFQDRLRVSVDVDPAALDARVPNLVLQPLVENAIKHGIAPHSVDGRVDVGGRLEGPALVLRVRDDGPGLRGAAHALREGVGLSNTRHHARDARRVGDRLQRVRVEQHEVGSLADLNRPELGRRAEVFGRVARRRFEDGVGRQPGLRHRGHLAVRGEAGHEEQLRRVRSDEQLGARLVERLDRA
ncbi:MAG TPA: histidine kinase, partial [Pyrinomonadaceae bacterium]|nr:histidine kinase [Pyrinomonadaceae bacterium]